MKWCRSGFTLIEVLVTMVIFSISSLAITLLMTKHSKLVALNSQSSEAIALAQDKLEDLRTSNFATLAPSGSTSKTSPKGTAYTANWTVQQNTPTTGMSTLTVTVTWTSQGVAKSYVTKSIFSSVVPS